MTQMYKCVNNPSHTFSVNSADGFCPKSECRGIGYLVRENSQFEGGAISGTSRNFPKLPQHISPNRPPPRKSPPISPTKGSSPIRSHTPAAQIAPSKPSASAPTPSISLSPKKGLAVTSLISGICSLVCFGILTGPFAIIAGLIAWFRANNAPSLYGGNAFAVWGMLLGTAGLLFSFSGVVPSMWSSLSSFPQTGTTVATSSSRGATQSYSAPGCQSGATGEYQGGNLRSDPRHSVEAANIIAIINPGATLRILSTTSGEPRSTTGNTTWFKVKVDNGTCTFDKRNSSSTKGCVVRNLSEGYVNADLVSNCGQSSSNSNNKQSKQWTVKTKSGISPRHNRTDSGKARLLGVYEITIPQSDVWLKTNIELRPGMEIRANFEDFLSPNKLVTPLSFQAGSFSATYFEGWGGSAYYESFLTTGNTSCKGCVYMSGPAKLEVKSPERGVRFRVELYENTKY